MRSPPNQKLTSTQQVTEDYNKMTAESKYATLYWHEYAPQVVQRYNLKPSGKERYNGPCPHCGGTDRFWINNHNGELRVNCNQCGDWKAIYSDMQSDGVIPEPRQSSDGNVVSINSLSDFDEVMPYFKRKGVPQGNAKVSGTDTLVPIYKIIDGSMKLVGKQTITAEGKKLFDKGMSQEAAFSPIGGKPDGITYICEGWATAASVSACTGRPAIFALNSGNLPKAAQVLTEAFPDVNFIVAADNDEAGIKAAEATGLLYRAPSRSGADWNDIHQLEGDLSVKTQLGKIKKPKPLFVQIGDLEFRKPQWVVQSLLEQHSFAVCFGAPAAGKTFVALDMALCVATGRSFHGHEVKQGPVFYIAGEGHNGFARRAAAWSVSNGVSLSGVPFFKSNSSVILTDESSVQRLTDVIDDMVDKFGTPALVVIDTLARAMGASDENSTKEMGGFVQVVDEIKDRYDTTLLAVHHTGHGAKDRARGSSALLGAVDAEFMVEKWSGADQIAKIEVKFTKMKDAKTPEPLNFAHKEIELIGADMEATQSVVLEPIDSGRPTGGPRLTGHKKRFMDALDEAKDMGENGANVQKVRDIFYNSLVDTNQDTKRRTWNRAFQDVSDMELITSTETMVYDER